MSKKRRNIIARRARISIFCLRPEVISGVEVIRLIHKVNISFHNPSSSEEPLFWEGFVLKGWMDVPESLKKVSSTINPERIYSIRDLRINGKPAFFKKDIRYRNSNEIEYQILCNKIAVPKGTYNVSYIEEGLYEVNDSHEDEIRTPLPNILIIVEKPPNLRVKINSFGENAILNVLQNSSRLILIDIRGKLTSGNGFSLRWWKSRKSQPADQNTRILDKICNIVEEVEKGQQTLLGAVREVKKEVIEAQELSQDILKAVQQHPEHVQTLLAEQLGELRQILLKAAIELRDEDPQKAKEAKKWYDCLEKGISITADVIQIVAFLTGIPSWPALADSDLARRVIEFLSRIARALQ